MSTNKTDDGSSPTDNVSADPTSGKAPKGAVPVEHVDETKAYPSGDRHAAETLAGRLENQSPAEIGVPPSNDEKSSD